MRIGGVNGVFSPECFGQPQLDPPYAAPQRKRATYYNQSDIDRALGFGRIDILLLHNWPDLMNAARGVSWPPHWSRVACEYLSLMVESLLPRWVFCGHTHHKAHRRVGSTEIICLSDLHRDPANAVTVAEVACPFPAPAHSTAPGYSGAGFPRFPGRIRHGEW